MLKKNFEHYQINKTDANGNLIERVKINTVEIDNGKMIPTFFLM